MKFYPEENKVKVTGRTIYRDHIRYLGYSASSISFRFTGCHASASILSDPDYWPREHHAWIAIYHNDAPEPFQRLELTKERQEVVLYEGEQADTVTITIMKYSEPEYAVCGIESITIDTEDLLPPPDPKQRKLQIIGDSISCGYGVEGSLNDLLHHTATENPAKAYSVLTARDLDADLEIVAWNGKGVITAYVGEEEDIPEKSWLVPMLYQYTDAGCSQQYFHEPKAQWEKWDHTRFVPDLVIIYLGTNDASYTREIPERNQEFSLAYQELLKDVHTKHPKAKILCTLGTMDQRLCPTVEQAVHSFADCNPDVDIHYLGLPAQRDEDGLGTFWHPSPVSHRKAADLITEMARKIMGWD